MEGWEIPSSHGYLFSGIFPKRRRHEVASGKPATNVYQAPWGAVCHIILLHFLNMILQVRILQSAEGKLTAFANADLKTQSQICETAHAMMGTVMHGQLLLPRQLIFALPCLQNKVTGSGVFWWSWHFVPAQGNHYWGADLLATDWVNSWQR